MEEKTKLSKLEEEKQNVDGRIAKRVQALARVQGRLKETYKVLQLHNGPLDRSRINAADQPVVQPWPDGKNNDRTAGADSNVSGLGQEHEGGDGATEAPLEDNVPTQQGTAWREGGSPQRSGELAPLWRECRAWTSKVSIRLRLTKDRRARSMSSTQRVKRAPGRPMAVVLAMVALSSHRVPARLQFPGRIRRKCQHPQYCMRGRQHGHPSSDLRPHTADAWMRSGRNVKQRKAFPLDELDRNKHAQGVNG